MARPHQNTAGVPPRDVPPPVGACEPVTSSLLETAPGASASGGFFGEASVVLPWPPAGLSPNARLSRYAKAAAIKAYRAAVAEAASRYGVSPATGTWALARVWFYPPAARGYDSDNLVARFKAGQDGLADAAGANDRAWAPEWIMGEPSPPAGCVLAVMRNTEIPG